MRRHVVILMLASLCAAESPGRAEQASSARAHRESAASKASHRERAATTTKHRERAASKASHRERAARKASHRERAARKTGRRARASASAPVAIRTPRRVRAQSPARRKPRLVDPRAALRALLVLPPAVLTTSTLSTTHVPWTRGEWDTRPVAPTTSGFVPSLSTDDWRLLVAAGLSGFALVSPITPAMGFPGLRTHQRSPAGLVCMTGDRLGLCLPALSAVKDPYHDRRWAGISMRVFEARF